MRRAAVPSNAPGTWRASPWEEAAAWGPVEWELYLTALPRPFGECAALEARFGLTARGNYEVLVAWLTLALASGFDAVLPRVEEVLAKVGRMKYLRPLYGAFVLSGQTGARFDRLSPIGLPEQEEGFAAPEARSLGSPFPERFSLHRARFEI